MHFLVPFLLKSDVAFAAVCNHQLFEYLQGVLYECSVPILSLRSIRIHIIRTRTIFRILPSLLVSTGFGERLTLKKHLSSIA